MAIDAPPEMSHFVRLARRGRPNTCASDGEVRARRLAKAIIDNAPGLDDEAIEGAIEFLRRTSCAPQAAKRLLEP